MGTRQGRGVTMTNHKTALPGLSRLYLDKLCCA
jgi:hypothetical protein